VRAPQGRFDEGLALFGQCCRTVRARALTTRLETAPEKAIDQRDVWVVVQARGWLTRELRASHRWPAIAEKMNWGQVKT
jgi:hypothetical protein